MEYLFRAKDGTIFNDEDECLAYEERQTINIDLANVLFFNGSKDLMKRDNIIYDEVYYISFTCAKEIEIFNKLMDDKGYEATIPYDKIDYDKPLNFKYIDNDDFMSQFVGSYGYHQYCELEEKLNDCLLVLRNEQADIFEVR